MVVVTRSDLALAALATAAVPGMQPVSVVGVRPSHARARYRTAVVEDMTGRRWLVRAPRDPASGAELERNDGLVRLLGRHLPFKVPAAAGYADSPYGRAAVYPFVEGRPLRMPSLPPGPGLAAAVGRAVAAVHNIPRALFEETGAPVFDAADYRTRLLAELDRAAETGHVPTGLLARWEEALEAAPLWQFATTPTHGSLDGSSFLVAFSSDDASSGRVVALTGWERAQVADPADDFAMLVHQASPSALDAVLDSYTLARSQRPDPHLVSRARLAAEMRLVHGLATAVWAEDQVEVDYRADQLRKLDRLTSVDDSLVPRPVRGVAATPPAAKQPVVTEVEPAAAEVTDEHPGSRPPGREGRFDDDDSAAAPEAAERSDAQREEPEITTEIPVLRPVEPAGHDEEPAWETSPADATVGQEYLPPDRGEEQQDVETAGADTAATETVATAATGATEESVTERLHTLYGMPTREETEYAERQPVGDEADADTGRGDTRG